MEHANFNRFYFHNNGAYFWSWKLKRRNNVNLQIYLLWISGALGSRWIGQHYALTRVNVDYS